MNAHARIPSAPSSLLATRAVIVSLKISQWDGHRLDRTITREINEAKNASADAGRYNKKLLPKEALEGIQSVVSETRADFIARTLPWIDKGGRIMAIEAHMAHMRWVSAQKAKFEREVANFVAAYPAYLASAPARLGKAFRPDDYPTAGEIEKKFSMEVVTMPVPTGDDFRAQISEAQADQIRSQIEEHVAKATGTAVREVYERIAKVVGRMVERLEAYKPAGRRGQKTEGVFRDSLVENVRDLIDIMPSLNITGDPALAEMAKRMRPLVQHSAETLRVDTGKRRDVAAEAQAILDSVAGMLA